MFKTYNIKSYNPKCLKKQYSTSNSKAIPVMKFINESSYAQLYRDISSSFVNMVCF